MKGRPGEDPTFNLWHAIQEIERCLLPQERVVVPRPVLVVMTGLPGSGKSYVAERLAAALPAIVVEADRVRKFLFPQPKYTGWENGMVHRASQRVMERLLRQGVSVIADATNLIGFHRRLLYRLAERAGARVVVVETVAPEETIRQRLKEREQRPGSASDADWLVYTRLAQNAEPVERSHFRMDTSGPIEGTSSILQAIESAMNGATSDGEQEGT